MSEVTDETLEKIEKTLPELFGYLTPPDLRFMRFLIAEVRSLRGEKKAIDEESPETELEYCVTANYRWQDSTIPLDADPNTRRFRFSSVERAQSQLSEIEKNWGSLWENARIQSRVKAGPWKDAVL